ncbi:MAG: bifunctional oligoribonuclease/PAP phosphatase NrnA [Clostridiales bacterium]|nr:bifunctional oligoribonuclease/PAP phosphatase NrnA [Clostridiales bacterium]
MNISLDKIVAELNKAKSVLIFPHERIDGDALGSSVAICIALRRLGKEAHILIEEELPTNLAFLDEGYCINEYSSDENLDVCLAVDCSDVSRLNNRKDVFLKGKITISLDHHFTNDYFADINYVNPKSAATAEVIYHILKEMDYPIDSKIAEALYAAITTDTGNFQYSNTSKETHLIIADLFDTGMDYNKVAVEIYQNVRPEQVKLVCMALSTMEIFCNGKANIAYVTQDMLKQFNATMDEADGVIEKLRDIRGIEIAIFLKEETNQVKVGLRAKAKADVSVIAYQFGGGGHKKAAGCLIEGTIEDAKKQIKESVQNYLANMKG